jgi:lipoprotein-anchoring transpeptidase ErfK/SrfK
MSFPSHTVSSTRPHYVGGSRGTTWREKMIHPRMYQLDWTPTREHRTPVRTTRTPDYGSGLPSKHAEPLGWGPDPSE